MTKCWICDKDVDNKTLDFDIAQDMIYQGKLVPGDFIHHRKCLGTELAKKRFNELYETKR